MLNFSTFMEGLRNKQAFNIIRGLLAEKTYDLSTYKAMKHCFDALRKADALNKLLSRKVCDITGYYILLENNNKVYLSGVAMEDAMVSENEELAAHAKSQFEKDCAAIASYLEKFNK